MKRFFKGIFIFIGIMIVVILLPTKAKAKSSTIESFDVDFELRQDSSFKVRETIQYRFNGEFHRVNRGITLRDFEAEEFCRGSEGRQCGGFDYITLLGVYDSQERLVSNEELSVEIVKKGYGNELEMIWEFASDGYYFKNESFTWIIEYEVYGGLGYFDEYDLFYWNVFPSKRSVLIEKGTASLVFPSDFDFSKDHLRVLRDHFDFDYSYNYDKSRNVLFLETENLPTAEPFTVMVKVPKDMFVQPASLDLHLNPDEQEVSFNGEKILRLSENRSVYGIPPGEHKFTFEKKGYHTQEYTLDFDEGEEKTLTVSLQMTPLQKLIIAGIVIFNILGCGSSFFLIFLVFLNYIKKGRDVGGRKTIVPWFKPPEGISPVLVGSIKDEKVHLKDITSTIINAAVRGYIQIEEIGKKKYRLIKIKEFEKSDAMADKKVNYNSLDESEVRVLRDIFEQKERIETEKLKNKFYRKISGINKKVYEEMVSRGYFKQSPDKVRKKHLAVGVGMIVLGVVLTTLFWMIYNYTCGPALVFAGIVKVIFSFFMPAKTKKGTEIYEKCKGFRMYLHTAERFKVQNLTPDKFEKFLPYAMVFGVEKQWAKNFEEIYTEPPDWYRGQDPWTTFNTIYLVNSLSRMNSATESTLASSPRSSSGGWSGGGWSGGGGFSGGFSGGGGGGGSVGAS